MLEIRKAQMDALDVAVRHEWHLHLAASMRDLFAEETSPLEEDALLARVARGDAAAVKYGINSRAGIMRFVGISFLAGEDFYRAPPVLNGLLQSPGGPEDFIERLSANLPDAIRSAVHARGGRT